MLIGNDLCQMLTSRQQQLFNIIRRYQTQHGVSPSISKLCELLEVSSKNSVHKLLLKLEQKGYIQRTSEGKIQLLASLMEKIQDSVLDSLSFPLLGSVKAGVQDVVDEDHSTRVTLDGYLVGKPTDTFLWEVNGDSMIDAGIQPGDLVLVERGKEPRHGDIVLAWVDGGNTLKRYWRIDGRICLLAENKKYPPIYPREELTVPGVVVGLVRKYR